MGESFFEGALDRHLLYETILKNSFKLTRLLLLYIDKLRCDIFDPGMKYLFGRYYSNSTGIPFVQSEIPS